MKFANMVLRPLAPLWWKSWLRLWRFSWSFPKIHSRILLGISNEVRPVVITEFYLESPVKKKRNSPEVIWGRKKKSFFISGNPLNIFLWKSFMTIPKIFPSENSRRHFWRSSWGKYLRNTNQSFSLIFRL